MLPNEGHCLRAKVRLSPLHVMVANQHISITYKAKGWTSPVGASTCHIWVCLNRSGRDLNIPHHCDQIWDAINYMTT